jgi:DNA-binding transcriptional MerR regulator
LAKGAEAFRTISEAAEEVGVAQHVLRFWETRFTFIKPLKRAGGRRFYRPSDVGLLNAVHELLHERGYTIKGVQKLFKEGGLSALRVSGLDVGAPSDFAPGERLAQTLASLEAAKARLDALLKR